MKDKLSLTKLASLTTADIQPMLKQCTLCSNVCELFIKIDTAPERKPQKFQGALRVCS